MRRAGLWVNGAVAYAVITATSCGEPFGSGSETTATGAGSVTGTTPAGTGSGNTTTGSGVGGAGGGTVTSTGAGGDNTTTGTTAGGGGTGPGSFCDDRFGLLTNYQLCDGTGVHCTFESKPWGQTCMQICYGGGVDCADGYAPNPEGSCNTSGGPIGCGISRTTGTVCVCLRTCNGGPPCEEGDLCSATGCADRAR